MTYYSRSISRMIVGASPLPTWRQAMTSYDTVYEVSAGVPDSANASLVHPASPQATHYVSASQAGWEAISGYSSGTYLDDVGGAWGSMVYASGGHDVINNQILQLNLSQNAPTFSWFDQPRYQLADVNGAEYYYNPTEFAYIRDNLPLQWCENYPSGPGTQGGQADFQAKWNRQFPVAFDGWIFPRKLTTGQLGNNVPQAHRGNKPGFVPASWTGGNSKFFAVMGAGGPFTDNKKPPTVPYGDWFNASGLVTIGGTRTSRTKWFLCDSVTKAWTMGDWLADVQWTSYTGPSSGRFDDLKRIYLTGPTTTGVGWMYVDFAAGAPGACSAFVAPSNQQGDQPNNYSNGAFTNGHPQGRHLAYFPSLVYPTGGLLMYDFDNNTLHRLNIGQGFGPWPSQEVPPIGGYDSVNNRLIFFSGTSPANLRGYYYFSIPLPTNNTDLIDATKYVVTKRFITFHASASTGNLSSVPLFSSLNGKSQYIDRLGVILIPQGYGKMLGFRPGP